jgi:hypothetical protein
MQSYRIVRTAATGPANDPWNSDIDVSPVAIASREQARWYGGSES